MHPIIRNILAVIAGFIVGGAINMAIISISGTIIAPPAGVDVTDIESLKSSMHLFEPRHFIFPFLAHALGTFAGALITALIVKKHKVKFALGVGLFFFLGGLTNVFMLPAPIWFIVLDLGVAYFPMAWLAGRVVSSSQTPGQV